MNSIVWFVARLYLGKIEIMSGMYNSKDDAHDAYDALKQDGHTNLYICETIYG